MELSTVEVVTVKRVGVVEREFVVHSNVCLPVSFASQSIILPVHNAEPWLDECLRSVLQQDFEGSMELSVFNDASKVCVHYC